MPAKGWKATPKSLWLSKKYLPPLPQWVDPIKLGREVYARNSVGLHVPALVLTVTEQLLAPDWFERITRKRR